MAKSACTQLKFFLYSHRNGINLTNKNSFLRDHQKSFDDQTYYFNLIIVWCHLVPKTVCNLVPHLATIGALLIEKTVQCIIT